MKVTVSLRLCAVLLAGVSSATGIGRNSGTVLDSSAPGVLPSTQRAALSASNGDSPAVRHAQTRRAEERAKERAREDREHAERRRSADEWRARGVETRGGDPRERAAGPGFSEADRARIAAIPLDQYPETVRLHIVRTRNQASARVDHAEDDGDRSPGWSQRLEAGQTLREADERLTTSVPRGLRRRLPPIPPDHEDILLEDRLVRVQRHSREIVDIVPVGPGRAAQVPAPAETTPPPERPRGPARR